MQHFSAGIARFPYKFHPRAYSKIIFETEAKIPGKSYLKTVWQEIIFNEMKSKGALIACSHISHTTRQGAVTNIGTNKSTKRSENQLVKLRKIYSRLFRFHFFSVSVLWKHLSESVGVCVAFFNVLFGQHFILAHISFCWELLRGLTFQEEWKIYGIISDVDDIKRRFEDLSKAKTRKNLYFGKVQVHSTRKSDKNLWWINSLSNEPKKLLVVYELPTKKATAKRQ